MVRAVQEACRLARRVGNDRSSKERHRQLCERIPSAAPLRARLPDTRRGGPHLADTQQPSDLKPTTNQGSTSLMVYCWPGTSLVYIDSKRDTVLAANQGAAKDKSARNFVRSLLRIHTVTPAVARARGHHRAAHGQTDQYRWELETTSFMDLPPMVSGRFHSRGEVLSGSRRVLLRHGTLGCSLSRAPRNEDAPMLPDRGLHRSPRWSGSIGGRVLGAPRLGTPFVRDADSREPTTRLTDVEGKRIIGNRRMGNSDREGEAEDEPTSCVEEIHLMVSGQVPLKWSKPSRFRRRSGHAAFDRRQWSHCLSLSRAPESSSMPGLWQLHVHQVPYARTRRSRAPRDRP